MSKTPQFTTLVEVVCVGHPSTRYSDDSRRTCEAKELVRYTEPENYQGKGGIGSGAWKAHRATLGALGWNNIKTLGVRQWLCPRCTKFVLDKRAQMKARWG